MKIIALLFFVCIICNSCGTETPNGTSEAVTYYQILGEAQGTTYQITYSDEHDRDLKLEVDSILSAYDLENSIYQKNSIISQLNESDSNYFDLSQFENSKQFQACFNISKTIYKRTTAFNPTIYSAVKFWGFYDKKGVKSSPSKQTIDSLNKLINFSDSVYNLKYPLVYKKNNLAKIDFNAIAQGHSVDVIADYFDQLSLNNYMIELGGEIRCKGSNPDGGKWRIGIDKPVENSNPGEEGFQFIAELGNNSLATSGNYRKFYEVDGQKYSHTINPKTGFPVKHSLLSVTVITDHCADADAYATAFMVMGVIDSKKFIENNPHLELEAYFVYDSNGELKTSMSNGFKTFILQ